MARSFSKDDEGKAVVNADGTKIGMVSEVRGETAHVDPDPGVTDQVKSRLGWTGADEETYQLRSDHVEAITDDEIRLSVGGM